MRTLVAQMQNWQVVPLAAEQVQVRMGTFQSHSQPSENLPFSCHCSATVQMRKDSLSAYFPELAQSLPAASPHYDQQTQEMMKQVQQVKLAAEKPAKVARVE